MSQSYVIIYHHGLQAFAPLRRSVAYSGAPKEGKRPASTIVFRTGTGSCDALSGADVDVVTVGVFDLPKASADVFAVGANTFGKVI